MKWKWDWEWIESKTRARAVLAIASSLVGLMAISSTLANHGILLSRDTGIGKYVYILSTSKSNKSIRDYTQISEDVEAPSFSDDRPIPSAELPAALLAGMQLSISAIVLTFSFIVVLAPNLVDDGTKRWAIGLIGTIIGFWLGTGV